MKTVRFQDSSRSFRLKCAGIKLIIPISFVGVAKRTQVERDGHNMGGTPHAVHALDKCRMSKGIRELARASSLILCAVRFYGYYQSALTVPDFSNILFQAGLNVILSIGNKPQVECVH